MIVLLIVTALNAATTLALALTIVRAGRIRRRSGN